MLNIFTTFKAIFVAELKKIATENNIEITKKDFENFTVEPTKDKSHGDLACNAAMVLSKKFSSIESLNNPRKLAQKIISKIKDQNISKLEIAGAGFINIFLEKQIFYRIISNLLICEEFSFPNLGKGEKINLEYASPNPTGPIHVGHTRGAIYGDVLANLLQKVGFEVLKEYYINDAGAQINNLIKSAHIRYLQACGSQIKIPEGLYPGEYLIPIGNALKEKFGESLKTKSETEYLTLTRDFVVDQMLEIIKKDLLALGIKHDNYFSEKKELHDSKKIEAAIKVLEEKGLIYKGKLEIPKTEKGVGAKDFQMPEGYDEKDQTLFASTKFDDDQDRVIKKADESYTYFAADLAYILSKFERGAKKFIMPLGYDHAGYVKRLTAATKALTDDQAELKIILCQMVKFVKNGEPVKMSKRAGNFITAREVIDEVGAEALRFIMLTRKNDAPFDFDLAKVIEQSKDNPIFYVQYAHARCCSVLRQAKDFFSPEKKSSRSVTTPLSGEMKEWGNELSPEKKSSRSVTTPLSGEMEGCLSNPSNQITILKVLENLQDESEIEIIKKIASFPRIIEMAAINFEPHRIAFYLQELAAEFHALWNKGTENPNLKFIIKDDLQLTTARIYLVSSVKKVIAEGLAIFNIKAVEEMR